MFKKLVPRETSFFDLFDEHASLMVSCAEGFRALVTDMQSIPTRVARLKEIEHEADTLTHRTVKMLHQTFITPIDRDEIHRLISRMDDVLDLIEAASERILLYEITTPMQEATDLAVVLVSATTNVRELVKGLRDMADPQALLEMCVEINRLENDADLVLRHGLARIFRELRQDPIEVMKWKELLETLEAATDRCEDVANTVEGILLEHA